MRVVLLMLALISFLSPMAQTHLPVNGMINTIWQPLPGYNFTADSNHLNQKWYFSKYAAISTGFSFFNGGSATFLSAPVGVQLNRQLNNNLIAFAGISVAPTFYSFSSTFTNPAYNKSYPGMMGYNPYTFGLNSRVEMGLMYINDAKTFSISGSIGVDRYDYPVYPHPPPERTNSKRP